MRIGDLVSRPTPLGLGDDNPTIAQACEVIGHIRACQVQISGQFRRVSGVVEQSQDDSGSSGVGQCSTQAVHHVETRSNSQHSLNYTALAELVKFRVEVQLCATQETVEVAEMAEIPAKSRKQSR
ncbi:hypothetical protein WU87_12545 [Corynebacterium minutissimum]|uniref:Uncharacterized protein n=1 Tax=Corynebacterium minutissimum TaxID=38301 RepID=A0ACC4U7U2_9CORY|nr:hypothetical protein WU87_12545 [Corynebacterium minutissimum]